MVPRRPPRSAVGLPRRVECAGLTRCKIASRRAWEVSRRRRADPVQVETLTPQQVRRVCTADSVSALASDPPRRAGMVCDMLHPYIPYYNRRAVLACAASGVAGVSGTRWRVAALWCAPVCRRRYYSRLCRSGICGDRMGQISGKAAVKPCKPLCSVGGIIALTAQNAP